MKSLYIFMCAFVLQYVHSVGGAPVGYRSAGRSPPVGTGAVGYDKLKSLQFMDYLSDSARKNIDVFDRLSTGLDMTIEDFFTFINKLLEDGVPDATGPVEDDFLSVAQLGQLFGGVNETAVHFILESLDVSVKELHGAFDTVDVIMVLMFVSSHLEAGGLDVSILDIIQGFCYRGRFDASKWVANVATMTSTPVSRVATLISQLEGGLHDIKTYVTEIVRPDTCKLLHNVRPDPQVPEPQPLMAGKGGLRGSGRASIASAF